jgi:hypothetical protein
MTDHELLEQYEIIDFSAYCLSNKPQFIKNFANDIHKIKEFDINTRTLFYECFSFSKLFQDWHINNSNHSAFANKILELIFAYQVLCGLKFTLINYNKNDHKETIPSVSNASCSVDTITSTEGLVRWINKNIDDYCYIINKMVLCRSESYNNEINQLDEILDYFNNVPNINFNANQIISYGNNLCKN